MSGWFDKIRDFMRNKKGGRGIENLVIILILGVIIIIVASTFLSDGEKTKDKSKEVETIAFLSNSATDELREFEKRLEQILSEIEGAGTVKVMVTWNSDGEVVHAYNVTEESTVREEQDGSERTGKTDERKLQRELAFMDGSNGRVPVVTQKIRPDVKGVVVVADGAGSTAVRQDIINAVEALLGIPRHRIQVLKENKMTEGCYNE